MDSSILAQAIAYGTGFTFGLFQTVLKKYIATEWKAAAFVAIGSLSVVGLYYGIASGSVLLNVFIAAVGATYAVTGGVDFYKNDMQPQTTTSTLTVSATAPKPAETEPAI